MLTLYHNNQEIILDTTEYYVRELASGLDEVIFDISIWDPNYNLLNEEANIVDRGGQRYLIKQIDAGAVMAKVVCQLDLDEWKASLSVGYDSGSKTVAQQVSAVCPAGWTVLDRSGSSISRTLHGDYTPLQVCEACRDVYQVYIRWDNKIKQATIYTQNMGTPAGSFATRELNLKEINYKGKSNNFATRLYAYGKDGLSFADINSGKPYVDNNTYSNRVICAYWQDERYTVKQNLLDDAREKLAKLAVPERSYDCAIVDLKATNPSLYGNLSFDLFTVATLIDDSKDTAINYQVVERHVWPYHPDRNDVIFNSSPVKIQNSVVQIEDEIINPNSTFSQIWAGRVAEATNWLTEGGGYMIALQDGDHWSDLLAMDTNDLATATEVLRINKNGIGFSHNGINGPYTSAWTIDGKFNADWILTGHMTANRIQAGTLESVATVTVGGVQVPVTSFNLDTGKLTTYSGSINLGWDSVNSRYKFSVDDNGNLAVYSGTISSTNGASTTTISGGAITTNSITMTGGRIQMDANGNNIWDSSTGVFNVSNVSGTTSYGLYADPTQFQLWYKDTSQSLPVSNRWYLNTGEFRIGGPSSTSPHIYLTSGASGAGFEIYSDANNYWNLKTGAFKTNNGTFTGSISASTITGSSVTVGGTTGSKLVIDSSTGQITAYYNNSAVGFIAGATNPRSANALSMKVTGSNYGVFCGSSSTDIGNTSVFESPNGIICSTSGVEIWATGGLKIETATGVTGTFTGANTVTVTKGIITGIS